VKDDFRTDSLKKYSGAAAVLLDGFRDGLLGGTGTTVDWTIAADASTHSTIILAGGLTPENVAQAIITARPYAVDVASGVESKPGKKDSVRVRAFMDAVVSVTEK